MDIIIELGKVNDINELEQLYNDLNDHLAKGVNYPGWIKGIYPVRENAIDGVEAKVELKKNRAIVTLTKEVEDQLLNNAVTEVGYEVVSITEKKGLFS